MKIVLLPGLDGTGDLFEEFVARTPAGWTTQVVRYPRDQVLDYDSLVGFVRDRLPADDELILLGESFSGPVAITLAATELPALRGLVLCNTFAYRPWWFGFRFVPWSLMFSFPLPRIVARHLGAHSANSPLEDRLRFAVRSVRPRVLARRLREVLTVDVTDALSSVQVPVLYLRGTQDALVGRGCLDRVRSLRPDLHFAELAAPHLLLQIRPTEAWEAISSFAAMRSS
jgi:pimeloyl-ACP methyl ester carboxylesterase